MVSCGVRRSPAPRGNRRAPRHAKLARGARGLAGQSRHQKEGVGALSKRALVSGRNRGGMATRHAGARRVGTFRNARVQGAARRNISSRAGPKSRLTARLNRPSIIIASAVSRKQGPACPCRHARGPRPAAARFGRRAQKRGTHGWRREAASADACRSWLIGAHGGSGGEPTSSCKLLANRRWLLLHGATSSRIVVAKSARSSTHAPCQHHVKYRNQTANARPDGIGLCANDDDD